MVIDLNSFERELPIDTKIPAGDIDLKLPNAKLTDEVAIEGTLTKNAALATLTGQLSGNAEIECDRCLEPQERPFDIDLDLEFVSEESFGSESDLELQSGDLKVDAVSQDLIDLKAIAREQILLDMPQQFFCKEDCKGLCQKCGANLNLISCNCTEEEIDPRWAALQNLN